MCVYLICLASTFRKGFAAPSHLSVFQPTGPRGFLAASVSPQSPVQLIANSNDNGLCQRHLQPNEFLIEQANE